MNTTQAPLAENVLAYRPRFGDLWVKDGWIFISWMTIVVTWGIALASMAGFSVSSRGGTTSIRPDQWQSMVALALLASVLGLAIMIWRARFWQRCERSIATLQSVGPHPSNNGGLLVSYTYTVNQQRYHKQAHIGRNSALVTYAPGDVFPVFFAPHTPQKSHVVI